MTNCFIQNDRIKIISLITMSKKSLRVCTVTWGHLARSSTDNPILYLYHTCVVTLQILSLSLSNPLFESYQISGREHAADISSLVSCGQSNLNHHMEFL